MSGTAFHVGYRYGLSAPFDSSAYVLNVMPTGVYRATPPVLTDGKFGTALLDGNSFQQTNLGTLLFFEDAVKGVAKVEQRYEFFYIDTAGTFTVRSSACFLHAILIGTRVANGLISIYNAVGGTTSQVYATAAGASPVGGPFPPIVFNTSLSAGLTVVSTQAEKFCVVSRA